MAALRSPLVNSGAIRNPGIIPAAAQKYGNQCVVPSTVLMDVIPAKVAGVGQIVMTTP
uniref:histidinol dehydrogenase n=1 Tax=Gemmiger formicilis TaxID=745368 RepID=UPI004029E56D